MIVIMECMVVAGIVTAAVLAVARQLCAALWNRGRDAGSACGHAACPGCGQAPERH